MNGSGTHRRRRLGVGLFAAATVAAIAVVAVVVLASWRPPFYAPAGADAEPTQEQASRRLVTTLSSLQAAVGRVGRWEAVIADDEVNAWFDVDLPRNHPAILPAGVRRPYVSFGERRIVAGAEVGYGFVSAVVWADAEVVLREINQVAITLREAGIGLLPVPGGALLGQLAKRLAAAGARTALMRIDGRPVLMVYIPATGAGGLAYRLEGFRSGGGEIVVEGVTRRPVEE